VRSPPVAYAYKASADEVEGEARAESFDRSVLRGYCLSAADLEDVQGFVEIQALASQGE
jgi:hypothetical protein